MAKSNIAGLGRFDTPRSAAGESYLKLIQQAGEDISQLGRGYMAAQGEIGRRKGEAAAMVKDADFSEDAAIQSMFGADAEELRAKIQGEGEDAYDFGNAADIARFKADIERFNTEVKEFEPIYTKAVQNVQDLEASYNAWAPTGFDPEQAEIQEVNGVEVYNAKAGYEGYNSALMASDSMRYNKLKKTPEGYIAVDAQGIPHTDTEGQPITYKSKQDYLKKFVEIGKPDYQQVPIIQGADLVRDKGWGRIYDTKSKATSAFTEYVTKHSLKAKRAFAENKDVDISGISDTRDEDGLTIYERAYRDDMVQEWVDEHSKDKGESDLTAPEKRDIRSKGIARENIIQTSVHLDSFEYTPEGVGQAEHIEDVTMLPLGAIGKSLTLKGRFERPATDDEAVIYNTSVMYDEGKLMHPQSIYVSKDGTIIVSGNTSERMTATGAATSGMKPYTAVYKKNDRFYQDNLAIINNYLLNNTGEQLQYYLDESTQLEQLDTGQTQDKGATKVTW